MYFVVRVACIAWIVVAMAIACARGRRGIQEGRWPLARNRLSSPTIYLFAAYVFVAALVTPSSPGESTSPLLWLALSIPVANAFAVLSSVGHTKPSRAQAFALALLHGGMLLAAAALILDIASPRFVPVWLGGPGGQ